MLHDPEREKWYEKAIEVKSRHPESAFNVHASRILVLECQRAGSLHEYRWRVVKYSDPDIGETLEAVESGRYTYAEKA